MATKKQAQPALKKAKKAAPAKKDQYYKAAYARGKNDGAREQAKRNELEKIHEKAMTPIVERTASISMSLFDNNDCNIAISGDFSVILNKLHEIQSKSITIDKGEFFAVAAKMMAGKEGK